MNDITSRYIKKELYQCSSYIKQPISKYQVVICVLYQNDTCYNEFTRCYRTVIANCLSNISTFTFCRAALLVQQGESLNARALRRSIAHRTRRRSSVAALQPPLHERHTRPCPRCTPRWRSTRWRSTRPRWRLRCRGCWHGRTSTARAGTCDLVAGAAVSHPG